MQQGSKPLDESKESQEDSDQGVLQVTGEATSYLLNL